MTNHLPKSWEQYLIAMGCHELHVSVAPGTDFGGAFAAFCHDEQETIKINGWNIDVIEPIRSA